MDALPNKLAFKRVWIQGYPLTPFLFLLVTEGLVGLFVRAYEIGLYFGFRVGNYGLVVPHL